MAANVETMFSTRVKPWHGLGKIVSHALTSKEAIAYAGLDWRVEQRNIYTDDGILIKGFKANVRDLDDKVLGIVGEKYQIVQNEEAFLFTDQLLDNGVKYETAGSLQEGKKTWMLAKLPSEYIMLGDRITPYLVFSNSHDGSGAIKIAMTPIRVVCQNTLNLALRSATRSWSMKHTGDTVSKLEEAKNTLFRADQYMESLGKEFEKLAGIKVPDFKVDEMIRALIQLPEDATSLQKKNIVKLQNDLAQRYYDAPDLAEMGKTGYRFVNAVSDFATHAKPLRETENYRENLFMRTIDGNALIDKAHQMVLSA